MPEIIKVSDVAEEYKYVYNLVCDNCGAKGEIKVKLQKLTQINGIPHDILECECTNCGKKYDFTFDVAECFKKYEDMFKK
ncbi:MAG: hypothetical protein GF364_03910 [Candidatus Lokiarchaeota archaeon]|nr:hypothetical protein [Candidatus Lokiarchaeota archaeon]